MGSKEQGEFKAISRQWNPATSSESELSLSGGAEGSYSESSEEAAAGLGRGPAAPFVGREYVQAFHIATKQVVLEYAEYHLLPFSFKLE